MKQKENIIKNRSLNIFRFSRFAKINFFLKKNSRENEFTKNFKYSDNCYTKFKLIALFIFGVNKKEFDITALVGLFELFLYFHFYSVPPLHKEQQGSGFETVPRVPTSSFMFETEFKRLKNHEEQFYLYIKVCLFC